MAETPEEEKRRDALVAWLKNPRRKKANNTLKTANTPKKEVDDKNDR